MKKITVFIGVLISTQLVFSQTYHQSNIGSLVSGTDANNQTAYGTYDFQIGNGTGNTNYPAGAYGYGNLIYFNSANFGSQFLVTNHPNPALYFRSKWSGFGQWAQVWTNLNFNPATYLPLTGGTITGNVGIGTTITPFEKLLVQGGNIIAFSPYPGSGNTPVSLKVGGMAQTSASANVAFAGMQVNYTRLLDSDFGSALKFYTASDNNSYERMVITRAGYIGIGTSNPTELLSVKGVILAQKVKVSTTLADWPDYVFEPSYNLRPLSSLEAFIKANKHLPDVPSAEEVGNNGVDLGNNQAVLLKKAEELTLYIIQQDKTIKEQDKKLADQGSKMNAMEDQLRKQQEMLQRLQKLVEGK